MLCRNNVWASSSAATNTFDTHAKEGRCPDHKPMKNRKVLVAKQMPFTPNLRSPSARSLFAITTRYPVKSKSALMREIGKHP
jgi:hypothetical protein